MGHGGGTAAPGTGWRSRVGRRGRWSADGESFERHTPRGLAGFPVEHVAVGADGTVWAGLREGAARFADGEWASWTTDDQLPGVQVAGLATGVDGSVWIATQDVPDEGAEEPRERLLPRTDDGWTVEAEADELPGGEHGRSTALGTARLFESLVVDADGAVWLAVEGSPDHDGLASGKALALAAQDTTVWAATEEGVARHDGDQWHRLPDDVEPASPAALFNAMAVGNDAVWLSINGGVARYDGREWTSVSEGLPDEHVRALAVAPDGAVWAGTNAGIARFDGQRWTTVDDDAPIGVVQSLTVTDDSVWVVTQAGLAELDR